MSQVSKIDRQREHQANERTFLAWLRTAIALITFGLAIARLGLLLGDLQAAVGEKQASPSLHSSQIIGIGLVIVGIILIALSTWHYNQVFLQIERGDYQPTRFLVWFTAGIVMILGAFSIPFVLWRQPVNSNSSLRSGGATFRQIDYPSPLKQSSNDRIKR